MKPSRTLQTYEGKEVTVAFDRSRCKSPGETVVTVSHGGPLYLRGNLRIVDASGQTIATGEAAALCRCGGTANPPFCDATHERIGFGRCESGATAPA